MRSPKREEILKQSGTVRGSITRKVPSELELGQRVVFANTKRAFQEEEKTPKARTGWTAKMARTFAWLEQKAAKASPVGQDSR